MDLFIIDDLLERMAAEGRNHFAPHYICQRLNMPDTEVSDIADYLLSLSGKKVIPLFQVECPEGDSDFVIENPLLLDESPRICRFCGIEYIPDPGRIWLRFNFTPEFINHVKKKTISKYHRVSSTCNRQPQITGGAALV